MIDVDLLDEPAGRFEIEKLIGEGTFGEVIGYFRRCQAVSMLLRLVSGSSSVGYANRKENSHQDL